MLKNKPSPLATKVTLPRYGLSIHPIGRRANSRFETIADSLYIHTFGIEFLPKNGNDTVTKMIDTPLMAGRCPNFECGQKTFVEINRDYPIQRISNPVVG